MEAPQFKKNKKYEMKCKSISGVNGAFVVWDLKYVYAYRSIYF